MSEHARLAWRCRRGTRELDLLLQGYLDSAYRAAGEAERRLFAELLELPDDRLQRLLFHPCPEDGEAVNRLVATIRSAVSV